MPKSRAGETARRVKKASVLTGRIEHKDASYLPRRRRPNGVCTPVVLRGTTSFAAQGSHSQRTYIRSPVTWAKRPYITADGVGVRFTQAARRGERFAPDYRRCIRWAALWERVLQRIMSCSSHLPNDCPYFSAEFTNCQYLWHKFGGCTNSEKRSAKIFR